jgi:hypothetical protein
MGLTWRDPAGALYALSPDIPGHRAGDRRDDTDHLTRSPASHAHVFLCQIPVTFW